MLRRVVVAPKVDASASAGTLVRHTIAGSVLQIMRRDREVRLGNDPEDVHQFRVGLRRLRCDLRTFAPWLDAAWVKGLRAELGWVSTAVGALRDSDVLAARLLAGIDALPELDTVTGEQLVERIAREGDVARGALRVVLGSERYDAVVDSLVHAANTPRFASKPRGIASRAARDLAPDVVRTPWKRLDRTAKRLDALSPDEELHAVRILAKHCRYASEAVAPVIGVPAKRFASKLATLQTVLGDHQDAAVAEEWLRAAARSAPDCAVAAGQLIALQHAERARARTLWSAAWEAASTEKLRAWM